MRKVKDTQGRLLTVVPQTARDRMPVEVEQVAQPNGAQLPRLKGSTPMTSPPERSGGAVVPGHQGDEGPRKTNLTQVDRALEEHLVEALWLFFLGTVAGEGRASISNYGVSISSTAPSEKRMFSEQEKRHISSRQYVYRRLPYGLQIMAELFCESMLPRRDKPPMTLNAWAQNFINSTDKRKAEGAVGGSYKVLAIIIHELQKEFDILQARKRAEARMEAERRQLRRGNHLPEDYEEIRD
jgi:hypothetical protein